MEDLLEKLNPEQRQAVTQTDGPLLVLAGAGSGKTRVIVHRIAYLVREKGVRPWSILAVTFTNKAAGEMRERLTPMLAPMLGATEEFYGRPWVSTFHSMGASILRREGERLGLGRDFTIYDDGDQISLARRVLRELNREADAGAARDLLSTVDRHKNGMDDGPLGDDTLAAISRYQNALRAANAVDFGDLLSMPLELFEKHPDVLDHYRRRFSHVLVDEFQDTNQVQYKLLKLLKPPPDSNLCVVGDDDQSIYRWRGAEVGNILGFETDYPAAKVVRLTQNYRSDGNILAAAAAIIAKNPHRHVKELWTSRAAGERISVLYAQDERDEGARIVDALRGLRAEGVPYGEMAIFFRINAQSRVLEEALRVGRVPYVIVRGRSFYEQAEIKDAVAYLRLSVNPRSDVDLMRVVNSPPRGIGDTTLERVSQYASERHLSLYDALSQPRLAEIPELNGGARARLAAFRTLLDELGTIASAGSAAETTQKALTKSGMLERLSGQANTGVGAKADEARERHENLMELVGAAREADERFALLLPREAGEGGEGGQRDVSTPLMSFLEQVALIGDADGATGVDRVSVMTMHAAKGLEFDAVFIAGLEEGVFPHNRALSYAAAPEEMHEERRLAYVGFTRARHRLFLAACRARALFGELKFNPPSRFMLDVPEELLDQKVVTPARDFGMSRGNAYSNGYSIDRSYDQSVGSSGGWERRTPVQTRGRVRRTGAGRGVPEWNTSRKAATTVTHVESLDWPTGAGVLHPTFGVGRILAADGDGVDAKLTIRFRSAGDKRIIARFVKRVG